MACDSLEWLIRLFAQPHFVGGYTGIATSDHDGTDQTATPDDEMSENDRKVIQSLKDWDLW